jgi:hypothetical protein
VDNLLKTLMPAVGFEPNRGHGKSPQAVAVKTESNNDTFLRLWRYLTVGEMAAEPKDVTD